jgi:hypothetical protein
MESRQLTRKFTGRIRVAMKYEGDLRPSCMAARTTPAPIPREPPVIKIRLFSSNPILGTGSAAIVKML